MSFKDMIGQATYNVRQAQDALDRGTGFLIGPNDFLTNSHVALNDSRELWDDFTIRFDDGSSAKGISVETFDQSPTGNFFDNFQPWETQYDLALVTLDQSIGLKNGWFGLTKGSRVDELEAAGYPKHSGTFSQTYDKFDVSYNELLHTINFRSDAMGEGASGSPVWETRADGLYVQGVNSRSNIFGQHKAALFSDETFSDVVQWVEDNGSAPDIFIDNMALSADEWASGENIVLSLDIKNDGDVGIGRNDSALQSVSTLLFLSLDQILSDDDVFIGDGIVSDFVPADGSIALSKTLQFDFAQDGMSVGSYYLIASADHGDAIIEHDESNNTFSTAVELVLPSDENEADLGVNPISHPPTRISPGDEISINYEIENYGTAGSGTTLTGIFLSTDVIIDPDGDRLLASFITDLDAGETQAVTNRQITLPDDLANTEYWVGVVADYDNRASETNEGNNIAYLKRIEVLPAPPEITGPKLESLGSQSVEENTTGHILTASVTGVYDGPVYYSLSGSDSYEFEIDSTTGAIRLEDHLDFEAPEDRNRDNKYEFTVVAQDRQGMRDTQELTVEVKDVVEVPPSLGLRKLVYDPTTNLLSADFDVTDPENRGVSISVSLFSDYGDELKLDGQSVDYDGLSFSPSELREGVTLTGVQAGNRLDFEFQADDGFSKSEWEYGELEVPCENGGAKLDHDSAAILSVRAA